MEHGEQFLGIEAIGLHAPGSASDLDAGRVDDAILDPMSVQEPV